MRRPSSLLCCFCFLACGLNATQVRSEDWTRFRGPNGQGVSSETELPIQWSASENVAWKTSIPGNGWSSPIVHGEHLFLTTTTEDGESCHVICVDRKTGNIRWDREVHRQQTGAKRLQNSYATPTPLTDGKQVYAVFADGTIVAVDYEGATVWKNSEVKSHSLHGLGASPILVGAQLIMPFDGSSADEKALGCKTP
ncbi:MAG: PQQ-binding-like beta-propeller repeat protein, partial [Planctomycetales bacterium]|nr:PQQ-binding-like beta-propeller repeat protein [Planctomycetales bacterium]